ncbi:hypothetical protein ACFQX6_02965 [Streptosporangium lutulentum]
MAIARDIVEAHEGSIRIEDGAEGGARFVVHLPWPNPFGRRPRDPGPA